MAKTVTGASSALSQGSAGKTLGKKIGADDLVKAKLGRVPGRSRRSMGP